MRVWGGGILEDPGERLGARGFGEEVAFLQCAKNCFAQCFHRARRIQLGKPVELRLEAALQQEIAEALHQFVEVDGVRRLSYVLPVFDYFHSVALVALCFWCFWAGRSKNRPLHYLGLRPGGWG